MARHGGWWYVLTLALLLSGVSSVLRAQVVRGTVTQETSGVPIAGAIVELFTDGATERVASALTDAAGTFALRAPGSGRYRLGAKRIGVRRFESAPFVLQDGETRTLDIALQAVDFRLPTVVVTADAICAVNDRESTRVSALWDEARTALDAAEISLRDKLFEASVVRYVRELDPKTRRVLSETRSEVRGTVASPFHSPPAESLSARGYWQPAGGGASHYYGPDANVLLSEAFRRDHCFRPVDGRGERRGMAGLAFSPVSGRPVAGVSGTLWLDARTFELRLVDFTYDRVPEGVDPAMLGGEIHFARLPSGAWIVRRWFLRVPVMGRPVQPLSTEGNAPWVLVRPTLFRLSEEGGEVTTDELRPPGRPARVAGVVRDSTGRRPFAGAVVRLGGTSRQVVTGADGQFTFDSLSPGRHAIVVQAPGYDSLGLVAADASVFLESGTEQRLQLSLFGDRELTPRLCAGRDAPLGRGTIHVTVRDAAGGAPVAGAALSVSWMSTVGRAQGDSVAASVDAVSDAKGSAVFCEIPAERELTLRVVPREGASAMTEVVQIRSREVRHVEVGGR